VFGFAVDFSKKILGKHACGTGNTHSKRAIECVFSKNFLEDNKDFGRKNAKRIKLAKLCC